MISIMQLNTVKTLKVYHFADDTNLLQIEKSPRKMQKQVNFDLKSLYKWLLANKISLNCSKTELIFLHTPGGSVPDLTIKMNGLRIYPSSYITYLGVYLDSSLNGNHHCNLLVRKLKRENGILCIVKNFYQFTMLYFHLI